jgi:hypothetical protein
MELARWLMVNAHRLSRRAPLRTAAERRKQTEAHEAWCRARNSLWSAAAKLRRLEESENP